MTSQWTWRWWWFWWSSGAGPWRPDMEVVPPGGGHGGPGGHPGGDPRRSSQRWSWWARWRARRWVVLGCAWSWWWTARRTPVAWSSGAQMGHQGGGFEGLLSNLMSQQRRWSGWWIFPLQELGVVGGGDHGLFWAADCWRLVGPYMRDISSMSHMWWDQCVAIAGGADGEARAGAQKHSCGRPGSEWNNVDKWLCRGPCRSLCGLS